MEFKRFRIKSFIGVICAVSTAALFSGFGIIKDDNKDNNAPKEVTFKSNTPVSETGRNFETHIHNFYYSAGLDKSGLSIAAFEKGITGYYNIKATANSTIRVPILTIIDFTQKSTEKRLWVIDMVHSKLLYHTLVAHGKNSGEQYAEHFSDDEASNMSSLGFYLTGDIYFGKHGKSLVLDGLENGFNAHAKERSVVMHAADYVSEDFIQKIGRLGRSQGCPALPPDVAPEIINTIADGSCLFIYYPDKQYEESSSLLDAKVATAAFEKSIEQK